ncbi:unnamed protein product [Rotaria sp. Silwood2]|nr:unnamed protein product [Rotaria sp. Silwood2]CAF3519118.1 unnamed protein product [Rotaria sp. Silwood2]CAF4624881.1 unnamed protein product [Rotaria sp. Silwood2]CAF4750032.1 unnamed protein product [Rotaria sp. Silwood2]
MACWPNPQKDDESTIIQQFKLLKDQLTIESALELCNDMPGCGFLFALYETKNLYYEGAFQAYLTLLRAIAALVSRSNFLYMFSKSCSGCAMLHILSILCLHPILENEVDTLFQELLCDKHGDILNRDDIRQIAMMMRQAYKRRGDPFPYVGDCLDYDRESQGFKMAYTIGVLFSSEEFCKLMKSNPTIGTQIAREMLKNPHDSDWQSNQLYELLSKYKELISDNKSDR